MSIQREAIYENGVLKFEQPLPFQEHDRVVVTIQAKASVAKQTYGLLKWTGSAEELDELLSADNQPWGEAE